MLIDTMIKIIKEFGYPIAISVYLLYVNSKQMEEMKQILLDLSMQISYVTSANACYKAGNAEAGNIMNEKADSIGQKIMQKFKRPSKSTIGGDNK